MLGVTNRDKYAIFDTVEDRLLEVGDYTDLDMGSLNTYDGPMTFNSRPDGSDDDLLECLPETPGRYKVVRIKVEVLEEVGDLIDLVRRGGDEDDDDIGGAY